MANPALPRHQPNDSTDGCSLGVGVVTLNVEQQLIRANQAARAIAARGDGLIIEAAGVRALRGIDQNRLVAAFKRAQLSGESALAIPRSTGRPAYTVTLTKTQESGKTQGTDKAEVEILPEGTPKSTVEHWLLCIRDPEARQLLPAGLLESVFELTKAQVRLAECLVAGSTVLEAADLLTIHGSTARMHLRGIHQKTRTKHLADLVHVLTALWVTHQVQKELVNLGHPVLRD